MKSITIRNLPAELARVIVLKSKQEGTSLNKTVIRLLEASVAAPSRDGRRELYRDLDALAGSWAEDEAAAFDQALSEQRHIDPELWR